MISGYVTINEVIYEACGRLGISNSESYEMRFMKLIIDAEKKIQTGMIVSNKTSLYEPGGNSFSDNRTLTIPHDLLNSLKIYDENENEIKKCSYSIRGNKIVFKKERELPVILKYIGIYFDINDGPVISHNHFEAVVSFIVFMETTTRYYSKKVPQYMFNDAKYWWQDRLGEARGDDAMPSSDDLKDAANQYNSIRMFLCNGEVKCDGDYSVIESYNKLFKVFYGTLPLGNYLNTPEDYADGILNNEIETNTINMSSNSFYLKTIVVGRICIILPYDSGLINSMKDANGVDIFNDYFNIIKDNVKRVTIYVAKNHTYPYDYKLTFGFSK